jgi:type II secretory pathway pseudopilin PulG
MTEVGVAGGGLSQIPFLRSTPERADREGKWRIGSIRRDTEMSMMERIAALARRADDDEAGLSIIELMVAIGILFVALLALARTATVAFTDVAVARQRQTGAQLANRLLEEVRGLPYETVQDGLGEFDLVGDPKIQRCGIDWYYPACPADDPDAEELLHYQAPEDTVTAPLVPHQGEVGPPDFPSTFSWSVYVTEAEGVPSEGAFRVTARVSWEGIRQGLRDFVETQTLIYAPEGCVDTSTHPFAAPCQAYFYGNGSAGGGGTETTGTVEGLTFDSVSMDFLGQSANAQVEQVTHVEGAVNLPLGTTEVSGTKTTTAATSAASTADDDPSSEVPDYDRQTVGPQAAGVVTVEGSGNQVAVAVAGSSQGTSTSTTDASTTNTCNTQLDGNTCGHATSLEAGALAETLNLSSGVGTASLVTVGTSGTPLTSYLQRETPSGGLGLVRETVSWVLPEMLIGGLPSGLETVPRTWDGYWVRLSGFSATATAESGEGTVDPTVTIQGGQIRYWDGSGYTTASVSAAGGEIPIAGFSHSAGAGVGNTVEVEIVGTVTVQPSSTTQTLDGSDRLQANGSVGSPMVVDMAYRLTRNDVEVADLAIEFDAGNARAHTVYQPAPTP